MIRSLSLFFILIGSLLISCNSEPAPAKPDQASETAKPSTKSPIVIPEGKPAPPPDYSDALSQDAPASKIDFSQNGDVLLCQYQAADTDLKNKKVEENGLSLYEAHFASMLAMTSMKCISAKTPIKMVSYIFLDKNNQLQGRFDFPCSFYRTVYVAIGSGAPTQYSTTSNGSVETIAINQLNIKPNNLEKFQQIVRGLQAQPHDGVKVGEVLR